MHKFYGMLLVFAFLAAGCGDDGSPTDSGADGSTEEEATPLGDTTAKPTDWPSDQARRMEPGNHPTPYTAQQLRKGCPDGRTLVYRIQDRGRETFQEWYFKGGDEQGVTWVMTPLGPDKKPSGPTQTRRMEWQFLQGHASFPSAKTHVGEATIDVPAGRFACMVYEVQGSDDLIRQGKDKKEKIERTSLRKLWFAWSLPGPPIRMEQRVDGELVSSMVLLENRHERKP